MHIAKEKVWPNYRKHHYPWHCRQTEQEDCLFKKQVFAAFDNFSGQTKLNTIPAEKKKHKSKYKNPQFLLCRCSAAHHKKYRCVDHTAWSSESSNWPINYPPRFRKRLLLQFLPFSGDNDDQLTSDSDDNAFWFWMRKVLFTIYKPVAATALEKDSHKTNIKHILTFRHTSSPLHKFDILL